MDVVVVIMVLIVVLFFLSIFKFIWEVVKWGVVNVIFGFLVIVFFICC